MRIRTDPHDCHAKYVFSYYRDANLVKRFVVFLGLKESILDEKTIFSPIMQYTYICVVINLEEKQYFPKSCSILKVFSSKNSTKYCKKITLGILAIIISVIKNSSICIYLFSYSNFTVLPEWHVFCTLLLFCVRIN